MLDMLNSDEWIEKALVIQDITEGDIIPLGWSKWEGERSGDKHLWLYYRTTEQMVLGGYSCIRFKNGEITESKVIDAR